jgi:hypothetical protein
MVPTEYATRYADLVVKFLTTCLVFNNLLAITSYCSKFEFKLFAFDVS